MEWYYEKEGAQSGPVSEDELKRLIDSGDISSQNLVWKEGMSDWSPYETVFSVATVAGNCPTCGASVAADQLIPAGDRQVCPNCRDSYAQGLKEGVMSTAGLSGGRGTGGMTPNAELRAMARQSLSGNWGLAVAGVLVLGVVWFAAALLSLLPIIGTIIQWLIYGPLMLGFFVFFTGIARQTKPEIGVLFSGFSQFWKSVGLYFMISLIAGLSALAAAIPGIILIFMAGAAGSGAPEESPLFFIGIALAVLPAIIVSMVMYLRYSMVFFLANDYPESGVFDTMKMSVDTMNGNKKKLFSLVLSFIGWHFLGMIAFYIGLLWSYSYMMTAVAAFYDDLGEES
jgi:uncharacterized membrane protein